MRVKTFDIANMVINDKERSMPDGVVRDAERCDILKEYCDAVDVLVEEFGATAVDVEVLEDLKILVRIELDYMCVDEYPSRFYDLTERAVRLKFEKAADDKACVSYLFPPVWIKGEGV